MSKSNSSSGIGFTGLIALVFITLKLCHVIDWSWWWVLYPLCIPLCCGLIIIAICGAIWLIAASWK